MSSIFSRADRERRLPWRGGTFVASLAAVSLLAAGCGSSGSTTGGSASDQSGSNPTTGSSASSSMDSSGASGITAADVTLPSGTPGEGKPAVTIGDKNFPEEYLLGDLYKVALEAKGYTVKLKPNIGGSEVIDTAFKSGQIDLYPEYLGEILTSVAGKDPAKTDTATYQQVKKFEESERDATILKQTPFQDVDTAFVKADFAKKYNLKSVADLSNVGPKGKGVTYVAQPPNRTRLAGLKGIHEVYGLTNVKFLGAPPGQQYKAVDSGAGNVGDAFSTDPVFSAGVKSGKYVALTDPKGIFGFQHVAPVIKKDVLQKQGPEFAQTLNWVDSLLTLKAVQALDTAIQTQHQDEMAVAKKFLEANGLKS